MSAISSASGLTTQTVKQLFAQGAPSQPLAAGPTDQQETAAEKIQSLVAQRTDGAKESSGNSMLQNSPPPGAKVQVLDEETRKDVIKLFMHKYAQIFHETAQHLNAMKYSPKPEYYQIGEDIKDSSGNIASLPKLGSPLSSLMEHVFGSSPPMETMADGSQQIGHIDMTTARTYGTGDKKSYSLRVVGEVGGTLTYTITDNLTGEVSTFVPDQSGHFIDRGNILDTVT